jgi:hypothetical protein
MKSLKLIPLLLASLLATSAFAQTAASETQRDINQQQRIESGLKSGQLSTKEAAKLEREQARVSRAEANALKDGKLSAGEKAKITQLQDKASNDIHAEKTDAQHGNPNSVSSKRMQADVQRNVNQQQRIESGIKNDTLTNHEVAKLEQGEAKIDHKEAKAGANGHISAREQRKIQHAENHQSKKIHHEKSDSQTRG